MVESWTYIPGLELAKVLSKRLEKQGLTVPSFAKQAGISAGYAYALLKGKALPPSEALILKFAEILHLDEEETDEWLSLAGRIRSSKLLSVLQQPNVLQALRGSTGIPIERLRVLTAGMVERLAGKGGA